MSRRWWALLAIVLVGGCAERGTVELTGEEREDALEASAHAPRHFTFERTLGAPRYRISGEVEDDYRYRATFALDGREIYEEVDADDRRMLRVSNAAALPDPVRNDPTLAPLLAGAWVLDKGNAPPEFPKPGAAVRALDPGVVLDAVRFLERNAEDQVRSPALRHAARHDPKSTRYIRRNDKFEAHAEDGVRYDLLPGPYDGALLFRDAFPNDLADALEPSALYVSYWFKGGRVTRVERFFDVDVETVQRDMRAAAERQAKRTGVPLSAIRIPDVPQPYREVYTFSYQDEVRVAVPQAAAAVSLPSLLAAVPIS